jgi:hypothetical protein
MYLLATLGRESRRITANRSQSVKAPRSHGDGEAARIWFSMLGHDVQYGAMKNVFSGPEIRFLVKITVGELISWSIFSARYLFLLELLLHT